MLGRIGLGALAIIALSSAAFAQTGNGGATPGCTITTTTSIGPNGETITRREGCGSVEITTSGGRPPTPTPATRNSGSQSNSNSTTTNVGNTRTTTDTTSTTTTNGNSTTTRTRSTSVTSPTGGGVSPPPVRIGGPNWGAEIGGAGAANTPDTDFPQPPPDFARIVLFDRADFRGRNIGITLDTPNLTSRRFDDLASSARLQGGVWELCSEPNYGGSCVRIDANTDLDAASIGNSVSSIRRIRTH